MVRNFVLLSVILLGSKISLSQIDIFPDTLSTCNYPSFYLDAGLPFSDSSASFLWSTGDTTSQLNITLPGIYSVIVTITNNGNKYLDTVTLINQDPPIARFDRLLDSLCVNCGAPPMIIPPNLPADYSYTWIFNDQTSYYPFLIVDPYEIGMGLYSIKLYVEDYYGCKDTASHWLLAYIIGHVQELEGYHISISPNPVYGQFLFQMEGKAPLGEVNILLIDQRGITYKLKDFIDHVGQSKIPLDVSSLKAGIYTLVLESKKGIISKKLIIQ